MQDFENPNEPELNTDAEYQKLGQCSGFILFKNSIEESNRAFAACWQILLGSESRQVHKVRIMHLWRIISIGHRSDVNTHSSKASLA